MSSPAPFLPASAPPASLRSRLGAGVLGAALLAATVAIWWRNHDILRDLYDASSIIVGVGKLESGLKPYADFRSTMQSATYVLNALAEKTFGANYLGLVKGGLAFNLLGAGLLFWLWRRTFAPIAALLLAGAVTLAGLAQHVFVFYNPLGLLCLTVVWAGLSANPRLWTLRSAETWVVVIALAVGGANKINFHALTLAVAVLLIVRSAIAGRQTTLHAALSLGILFAAGLALPLVLELAWTGASFRTWAYNVLVLPSERVGFALHGLSPHLLWRPPYDVHHSVPFKPFNALGLGLAAAATVIAWRQGVRSLPTRSRRFLGTAVLLGCAGGIGIGGLLLTTTNVEVITLTSLAFPVGAATLVASHRRSGAPDARAAGSWLVPSVSIIWLSLGGYSAWQGSRVIFGDEPPRRETYLRLSHPGPALAYLRGVRLEPGWHDSLLATVKEIERIEVGDPGLSKVLFGPAFEWMERAYPASVVREMPVWYHHGTSLGSDDGPWLESRLREKGVERLILNPHWESWPGSFWLHLAAEFRYVDLGRFVRVYERKRDGGTEGPLPAPVALQAWSFREHTGSNVHWNATRASPGVALFESPWGRFAGRPGGADWRWDAGPYLAQGNFVLLHQGGPPVETICRVVGTGGGQDTILFAERLTVSSERSEIRVPFQVSAGGNPIRLSIDVPPGAKDHVLGGWRDLRIGHAGPAGDPPPALVENVVASSGANIVPPTLVRLPADRPSPDDGWHTAPLEFWQPVAAGSRHAGVAIELQRRPDNPGHPTLLTLAWYKAGRIEFLRQTIVHPAETEIVQLESGLPEEGGWVGVLARAADPSVPPGIRLRAPAWR